MAKSSAGALARLLDAPDLARVVPPLAPETLHQLLRHSGLDACGEIVALATPAQLASVLDLDLWRSAPGHAERFDADRFGEWLELLAETGGAARIVASLDLELVVAGLSRHVRVFDPATFEPTAQSDDEPIEDRAPHEGPESDVGGYLVRAHRAAAWDAIVVLLTALDADHPDRFHAVMRGVRRLSNSTPEIDGLDDLLLEPEQQLHDVALDRDRRRSQQGYTTPADARAFLQMARQGRPPSVNPIAAEYLRAADAAPSTENAIPEAGAREALDAVVELLAEAGVAKPRPLLEGPESSHLSLIRMLMETVRDRDPAAYLARGRELAFLANALVAGCSIQGRCFTPQEASDAAVSVCQLGLDLAGTARATFLVDHDLIAAFESGWAALHDQVSMFVADELVAALADLRWGDPDVQEELNALRIEITHQHEAGAPWAARGALEVIAMLDMPAWASLLGLLDECPVIPAALTAALERRTGAVRATEFAFISTRSQLGTVREFMARLPRMLRKSPRRR
jgi:hypothetical protein